MFRDCNYPKFINFLLSLNAGLFLYMFGNFYYINYIKNAKRSVTKDASLANGHANSNESKKITNGHEKMRNGPEKMSNGHEKMSNGYEKMSNGHGKMLNGHGKISNGTNGLKKPIIDIAYEKKDC